MISWSDVEAPTNGGGGGTLKWSDIEGDQGPSYLERTAANIPESAAAVGHAMIHPEEEVAGIYALGQRIKKRLDEAAQGKPISISDVAKSAASHIYNAITGLPQTFEKDPVGTAVTAGLLAVGGPEAGLARGVKAADEAATAARVASLPERLATLPETPAPEAITKTAIPATQRAAALKAEAANKMNVAKASEEALPTTSLEPIVSGLKTKAGEEGYNPRIHKKAKALFKEFDALLPEAPAGPDMSEMMSRMAPVPRAALEKKLAELKPDQEIPTTTLKDIHQLRQQIRSVSGSADPNERLIGGHMKDALDDYMSQFAEGKTMTEGMKQYAMASWAQEIEDLARRAELRFGQSTQQGRDQIYSTEFRRLARNDRKMRMLRAVSPDAAKKVEQLAGGGTVLTKILKGMGTAAPRGVMPFTLDTVAGHLFHSIIPGGPYTLMALGTGAKYLGGKLAQESIEDIMNTIMQAPKLKDLQQVVSPTVFEKLMSRPRTAQAIRNWANATGDRKRIATIALTAAIAKEVNRPDLQQRIKQEIDNVDPERETVVPKTQQAMQ